MGDKNGDDGDEGRRSPRDPTVCQRAILFALRVSLGLGFLARGLGGARRNVAAVGARAASDGGWEARGLALVQVASMEPVQDSTSTSQSTASSRILLSWEPTLPARGPGGAR
jgi:hypothetical protein